jgi:hypothetical protein
MHQSVPPRSFYHPLDTLFFVVLYLYSGRPASSLSFVTLKSPISFTWLDIRKYQPPREYPGLAVLSFLALVSATPAPAAVSATTTARAARRTPQPPFPIDVEKRGSNGSAIFRTTGSGLGTGTAAAPGATSLLSTYTDDANGVVYGCTGLATVSSELIGGPG